MTSNSLGKIFTFTTWGESHGKAIGCVIDGVPSNINLSEKDIQPYLDKRKPGQSKYTTQRKEKDIIEILSGTFEGKTTSEALGEGYQDVDEAALRAIETEKLSICHKFYESNRNKAKVVQYFFPNYDNNGKLTGTISFASISDTN